MSLFRIYSRAVGLLLISPLVGFIAGVVVWWLLVKSVITLVWGVG